MTKRWSMGARLTLIAAIAVAATAFLVCSLAWLALRQTQLQQADQELRDILHGPISQLDPALIEDIPNTPLTGPTGIQVQARLPDGRTISAPQGPTPLPFSTADELVANGTRAEAHYTARTDDGQFRILTSRGQHGETIQLARSLKDADATLSSFGLLMIALVVAATALAAIAGRLVAHTGLRPIHRLTGAATHIAVTHDLRRPVPTEGTDEVAQLGRAFNSMLAALGRAQLSQKELIEDAAHELRTPMTSMRTNIEVLIGTDDALTRADRSALLADLHAQSIELSTLIADLVDLARSATTDEPTITIDLADLVTAAIQRAQARTPQADFRLITQSVTIDGQPAALERAIVNLLDNAVKFGPVDQTIAVQVGAAATVSGYAEISVTDRAPTIPEAERERVFDRFHRLDTDRAVPGSGLGLAIVAQTAAAHGGIATVEPRHGNGNTFRLYLPSAAQ
jgi:two-component system sensor histidine kinase MprB